MRRLRVRSGAGALALLALAGGGCATTHRLFTNPTGQITLDRQEFIDTYAVIKVLYKRMYAAQVATCARPPAPDAALMQAWTCQRLPAFHEEVRALDVKIQAKIEVPESRIDWATVSTMLEALIGLVP